MRRRAALAVICSSGFSGCGYRLRGSTGAESGAALERSVHVNAPAALKDALLRSLSQHGAYAASKPAEASLRLNVLDQRFERRLLSVDAVTGKEREFELLYLVHFEASRSGGGEVLAEQSVKVLRDIVITTDAIVARQREEQTVAIEMREAAAAQIARRLSVAVKA
ncbi:MAG: LPS assembly lipoprotein LptE [Gammaproteobacteria bacterium]